MNRQTDTQSQGLGSGARSGQRRMPLLIRRLSIDPAVSSVAFVTTFTDLSGFLIFLAAGGFLVRALG